jgi:hypothetical protein
MIEDAIPFASREYWTLFALAAFGRGMDFLSTWVATPNLLLEGNPLVRRLGWKWSGLLNLAICFLLSFWVVTALVVVTTSLLVAARNFQGAWTIRALGEHEYLAWRRQLRAAGGVGLYLGCVLAEAGLTALVGAALVVFTHDVLPFSIGVGVIAYALALVFFTLLSLWRSRRGAG